jgi:predicted NAD-dependent protein-ADP-ribosyltransferase YbiA (DUF1768 family)
MAKSTIMQFTGEFQFLSNFYAHPDEPISAFGCVVPTVEHAYQAYKAVHESEKRSILYARSPGEAKRLGRRCTMRNDWDQVKVSVMGSLVRQKFVHPRRS